MTGPAAPPIPEAARVPLATLANAIADAAAALASDDLAAYRSQLPAMRTALAEYLASDPAAPRGPLAGLETALADPDSLESARRAFVGFSTAVTDLSREHHIHHTAGLHVFECPMASPAGKGRWLQRDTAVKNPFLGRDMLTCGEELR